MERATLDGATIAYEDTGGNGPPVVFSHGILMDREMFAPQVGALSARFRCISWDQRGHGETATDGSWSYWDSAKDVLGLMDHLELENAFLVGMSQGGFLSLRAALLAPDRVKGLVFIDSQAGTEDPENLASYELMKDMWMRNEGIEALAEASADIILAPAEREPWIAKWLSRPHDWIVEPFNTLVGREDLHDRLGEVPVPALVIHGTADAAITMARAKALCAGLRGCEGLIEVEGGGHASNLSHPEVVTPALSDFLERHAGGT